MIHVAMAVAIQTHHNAIGDLRTGPCPEFFNQAASQLLRPVADQERDHLRLCWTECSAFSPIAVSRVREQCVLLISGVPVVLRSADLPNGGFLSGWPGEV